MISQAFILAFMFSAVLAHQFMDHGHHVAHPYKFGYSVKDHHGEQHREESGDGGHRVRGSYGFTDSRGIRRQVNYVADHGGFRAEVKTNEPGTANQNPAAVHLISDAPVHGHLYGGFGGYGYGEQGYPGQGYGNIGYGYAGNGYGYGNLGYGYGGNALGYNGLGYGEGYGGYGLASALLGTLPYARYGY